MSRGGVLVVALVALLALPAGGSPATTTTVTVRLAQGKAVLSRRSVPTGTVRFVVTGAGRIAHEFVVAGRRTRFLKVGQRQTIVVGFARPGAYRFVVRRRGVPTITRGTIRVLAPEPEPPAETAELTLVGAFDSPTDVDAPPGDASRLFVVEQRGVIWLLVDGQLRTEPFLDLREQVLMSGEAGLLGLAFAPDYTSTGLFYVYFNDRAGNIHLVEHRRSEADADRADPASARELLYQVKFAANHNGGMLQFGPDGSLYVAVGDGGLADGYEPGQFAQSPDSIFGKILRVDPATGERRVWASGLRNPWRFWIDAGQVYIGDVGQQRREEVNVVPVDAPSVNFGWPCFEGTLLFDETKACANVVAPVHEYGHAPGACSITGGVVVRDGRLPALAGVYLFADFCGTQIHTMRLTGTAPPVVSTLPFDAPNVISFGVDGLDRVHVGTVTGNVFRLDPAD